MYAELAPGSFPLTPRMAFRRAAGLSGCDPVECVESLQLLGIAHLVQVERLTTSRPPGDQEDDLLVSTVELKLLKEHEMHRGEPLSQPAANGLGVADGQKLRGEDHRHSTVWFQKPAGVHE